jgi:nucleotidyltransferase substrate binding protein (TIGR01987 family)
MKERIIERFGDYKSALERLEEGLQIEPDNSIIVDGVIQRFEFTFELAWKLMKDCLEYEGIEVKSPRTTIKEAYRIEMVNDGDGWIDMMIDRNKTSHIYDENEAKAIYKKIKVTYIYLLRELAKQIQQRLEKY